MNLKYFHIRNFRRLKDVHIQLESPTSIFVGANNSGKTSATHAFQFFLGEEKFSIYDFSTEYWKEFNDCVSKKLQDGDQPIELPTISLDLWFEVQDADLHRVIDLLPDLKWQGSCLGVRVEYASKGPTELIAHYLEAKSKAGKSEGEGKPGEYNPWPKDITDFLTRQLNTEFEKRFYVLDRAQFDEDFNQMQSYVPLVLGNKERGGAKIIQNLLRVDFLNAQRHISDVSSPERFEDLSKRLSRFYERNLQQQSDDEIFSAVRALANSENQLNAHLAKVFAPTLSKLNDLGYPGFFDPHLVIKNLSVNNICDFLRV